MTEAALTIKRWREDPVSFVREEFGVEPDFWQAAALRSFARKDARRLRIALLACAGPGKTAALAWMGWNFLLCYGDKNEHPKGACVSVTADNLKDNLWPEFSKWQQRSKILTQAFVWTKERIFARDHPETWFLSARSWSKTADAEQQGKTLSGIHSKYVLILIDESGAIPLAVLRAGEQALSNCEWGRIVQAGNPTDLSGMLYVAQGPQREMWELITITGDPDDPNRSPRIDIEWARQQIKLHGRDNPWVMAYILGLFPPSSINVLLGPQDVEQAMRRGYKEDIYSFAQKRIGVDIAREGDDRTVLFPRQGLQAFQPVVMRTQLGGDIAARVALGKSRWGSEMEFFDDTGGWGGAAIEAYNLSGNTAFPVNFAGKADDPRYANKRAEMWFRMAGWVKRGGALPNIPELVAELTTPTYTFVKGKFLLQEKDQIKKLLKRSPDLADALALTFAIVEMSASPARVHPALAANNERVVAGGDWDPFSNT